jgi:ADP-heptose:LPS heptosyltransferase
MTMEGVIVRPAALGDTLMLLPALSGMDDGLEVTVVGRNPGLDLLRPYTARAVDYDRGDWHHLFSDSPDPVLDLPLSSSARTALFLTDPEGRAKQNLSVLFPNQATKFFPPFPPKGDMTHTALYLARCIENAGFPLQPEAAFQSAQMRHLLGNRDSAAQGKGVLFHPGSGGREKNYSPRFWLTLIKEVEENALGENGPLRVLLGPAEEGVVSFFKDHLGRGEVMVDICPSMDRLVPLLEDGALYIGHDSGITHLAALVGIPTLALFKSSSLDQWHPLGVRVHAIEALETETDLLDRAMAEGRRLLCRRETPSSREESVI